YESATYRRVHGGDPTTRAPLIAARCGKSTCVWAVVIHDCKRRCSAGGSRAPGGLRGGARGSAVVPRTDRPGSLLPTSESLSPARPSRLRGRRTDHVPARRSLD